MPSDKIYSVGTISVTNGSVNFTGQGTAWDLALLVGGIVYIEGAEGKSAPIEEIVTDTTGTFALPWEGPTLVGVPYTIYLEHASAADAIQANANLLVASRRLRAGTLLGFNASGTLAQRAAYDDEDLGFVFLQTDVTPFVFYVKESSTSGDWSAGQDFTGEQGPAGQNGVDGIGDAYDVHFSALGRPGGAETFETLIARTVTFPASFAGSVAKVAIAPTAEAIFSITQNGTEVGTITFAIGSTDGVFGGAGAALSSGNILAIVAPNPRDDTLSGVLVTLAGNR